MSIRSSIAKLLLVLSVCAVAAVQVLGGQRGYLCDCDGRPVLVQTDHCHGPHGSWCHDAGAEAHHDDGLPGDTEQHQPVKEDLLGKTTATPAVSIASPLVLTMPPGLVVVPEPSLALTVRAIEHAHGPPLSVAVARSVVWLI